MFARLRVADWLNAAGSAKNLGTPGGLAVVFCPKGPTMALSSPERARQHVATLTRHYPGSKALSDAQRDLAAAKLEQYVAKIVSTAPPLTPAQLDRLASLLRPSAGGDSIAQ